MAIINILVDTKLVVEGTNKHGPLTGTLSDYASVAHPGTGKQIVGWEYDSRTWPSDDNDNVAVMPALSNADLSLISKEDFQSGIGSGEDCKVESIEDTLISGFIRNWYPKVKHGTWYDQDRPYYLYADFHRSQYALFANIMSGVSFIDMAELPKEGVPILARIYIWNETEEEYLTYINFERKVHFTGLKTTPTSPRLSTWNSNSKQVIFGNIDTTKNEFILLYDGYTIPRILFNNNVLTTIGSTVSSGADLVALETLGTTSGADKIYFHTKYTPIDKTQTVEVYTYTTDIDTYQLWTCRLNGTLTHSGHECTVDTDLGIVEFGGTTSGDVVPPANATVLIRYTYTAEVIYETQDTNELHTAFNLNGDVNPLTRTNNRGFIIINRNEEIPMNVVLTADEPLISANLYGPVDIGNQLIPIHATVTTGNGTPVEHIKVTFDITNTIATGHFTNGTNIISTYTNDKGIATTYYDTPASIDDVSEFIPIAQYSTTGGNTILTTALINVSATQREVFLYSVWKDDPYQGINIGSQATLDSALLTTQLSDYYKQFFIDESIYGPTGLDPGTGLPEGLLQSGASWWENRRRILTKILTPVSYNRAVRNGRKQIVATWSSTALDPHYHETGAFVPLQPTSIVNTGPSANAIHYNGVVLTAPGTGDLDGYLLISPTAVSIKATVYDQFSDKTITSNTITVQLKISDALNGTVFIDDINAIPANTVPYVLNSGDNGKILPLGFKIRQTGNTLASAIQAVTYIDMNPQAIRNITFNVDKIV